MSPRPFLGWRVVTAAFVAQLVSTGCTFGVFGVFVRPLAAHFGVSEGRFGLALSIAFLAMGVVGPLIGRWIDRGLARPLMVAGAAITGVGLLAASRAETIEQLAALCCGVVAIGAACCGPTASAGVVANWFVRRRGLALGITVAGATVGSWLAPPLGAWLIETIGWRDAIAWLGAGALAIGVPVLGWFIVGRPEQVGQLPDGDTPRPDAPEPAGEGLATGTLLRDSRLWLIQVGFALVFTSPIVVTFALVPFGESLGFSRQAAAYFFTAMAPFSLLGKVVFGSLADRVPPKPAIWGVVVGNVAIWALLYTDPSYTAFLAIGALYGAAIGAAGPLQGVVLGACFGREAFGRAMGIGGLASLPLIAAAPAVAGLLRDATGSYHAVFLLQIGLLLAGGLLLSGVRVPRHAAS